MRPQVLYPLFAPVTKLPGVGPRIGKAIERLAGPHVADLCWHLSCKMSGNAPDAASSLSTRASQPAGVPVISMRPGVEKIFLNDSKAVRSLI